MLIIHVFSTNFYEYILLLYLSKNIYVHIYDMIIKFNFYRKNKNNSNG